MRWPGCMMKIGKIALLVLLLFGAQAQAQCVPSAEYTPLWERYKNGLLLRMQDCSLEGGYSHYLMGTFHTDSPAIKKVAAPAFKVLAEVDVAAFELVAQPESQARVLKEITYPLLTQGLSL